MSNKGKILAVDDTSTSLRLLTDILKSEGYEVLSAISGELALNAAKNNPPDLVLLDIRMPGMDGYEVCRFLKAEPATRNVPVIFLSAASEIDEKVRGFEVGAVDFVTKPYQRNELLARVRTHLELSRLRDHLENRVAERTAELYESELKYRTLADSGQALIWTSGSDKLCDYFNKVWLEFTGRSMEQEMGNGWAEGVHPDDFQRCQDVYVSAFDRRENFGMDYRLRHHDGEYRWIRDEGCPRYNSEGEFIGYIGYCLDITERKEQEWHLTQLSLAINRITEAVYLMGEDAKFLYVNDEACRALGYTREEFLGGMGVTDINLEWNMDMFAELWQTLKSIGSRSIEGKHRTKSGREFPVEIYANYFEYDGHGYNMSLVRDITQRRQEEENLRITASVFENSQEAILITNKNNTIIDVNPAFTRITSYSREEVIGKNPRLLSSGRQDKAFYAMMWQSLNQDRAWRGEIWNRRKSGEVYPELLSISVICDNKGQVLRYVGVFSDISHIKEHEVELNRVANYDALTGIPNRVLLADRMKQAIAQTSREQNMMAICYLDLDGFKPINDTMGHETGDHVLIEVSRRIESTIRGGDTVARLGGDEFVVLLLGLEKGEECVTTLERLLTAIAQPITFKCKSCTVSASIGVSIYPLDNEDPDILLRHADQAMYMAKQAGKNRFYIYDLSLDQRTRDQHEFLQSIRHGLENNQFELYYQPKINLRTKELVGAEALIRWQHPKRGLLSPGEFLHHIENTDLDIEIGEWVTATALAQMKRWRSTGLDIEVSINISGYHMESTGFVESLRQQLARYPDMLLGKLQIEVLETVALYDIASVREIIESCRKIGVEFALDDFGTGYSSLSYLSGLPVDALKIDQSFVRDMLEDKGDMAIVQGIIALARAFDRKTVAEGIETKDHYQVLLDMGCESGQGYFIARPMPAHELINWQANFHF